MIIMDHINGKESKIVFPVAQESYSRIKLKDLEAKLPSKLLGQGICINYIILYNLYTLYYENICIK